MEVIFKEGMLHLQGAKFGKRTWRKIWMVLFKPSSMGVGRLEFRSISDSEQLKASRQKTQERKVVRFSDCLSVTPAAKESCPARCTAFYLNTTHHTYTFASMESQDWISALCCLAFQRDPGDSEEGDFEEGNGLTMADNDLYSSWKSEPTLPPDQYKVKVLGTDAAKRCKLAGEYVVFTDSEALELLDVNTGGVVYSWPYRLLRKFGQVEGGFCIEAGRRCDSGEGVFTFLTRDGPQIYQTLARQCSLQKKQDAQPSGIKKRPSFDASSVALPTTVGQNDAPPIYSLVRVRHDKEDSSVSQYATINLLPSEESMKHLCLIQPYLSGSKEEVGEESKEEEEEENQEEEEIEGEDDRCHSLEAVDEDSDTNDSIYYNLRKTTPPLMRKTEIGEFQCVYSETKSYSSSNLCYSNEPSTLTLTNADHFASARPQSLHLPLADAYECAGYSAQAADNTIDPEEAISSTVPSEPPGSFKQRLAEIISKDLAKFQPPLPY
ncbi:docking protein 3 [Xiphophorus couchianus]|uniref:docking protein 3 n=1 Tax=Xiphophorus couchianus TaxID=32473 RepID=UPI0010171FD0|nr:docking protein 3 [Xiphophorus couchianus]